MRRKIISVILSAIMVMSSAAVVSAVPTKKPVKPKPVTVKVQPKPAQPQVQARVAPDGLADARANAYFMLETSKYGGTASGATTGLFKDLPFGIGNVNGSGQFTTKGSTTTFSTKTSCLLLPNKNNESVGVVPFIELVDADKSYIVSMLKNADDVSINDGVITVKKTPATKSFCAVEEATGGGSWKPENFTISFKISVTNGKVVKISDIEMNGKINGKYGDYQCVVKGDFSY